MTTISVTGPAMRNNCTYINPTSISANVNTALDWKEDDNKTIIVINASNSGTLTVFAGNGIQGAADLECTFGTGINLIKLESGRFKNVSGDNKGKIIVKSSVAVSVGVVALV